MPDYQQSINDHYGQTDLSSRILKALQDAGKDINSLTREDLSSFDEFHNGGLAATRELASLAALREGMRVLDVGCGVGGPARTLAAEFGCYVTGIDLTEEFCRAAEMLTARLGMADKVTFRCGSALELPFDDESFDAVWMQNVSMNIADKSTLYSEIRRVLRAGGRLATQDVLSGPVTPLLFPMPWADDPSINFLIEPERLRQLLEGIGLKEVAWTDTTEQAIEAQRRRLAAASTAASTGVPVLLGVEVLYASGYESKMANILPNYEERRALVVTSVFERV